MARTVTQVCEDALSHAELLSGCNLFVQRICVDMGFSSVFSKTDNADAMIAKFGSAPFNMIGKKPDEATRIAGTGELVLAGLTKAGMTYRNKQGVEIKASMGHIVVVVPGGPSKPGEITLADGKKQARRGGYPYCFGGAAIPKYRIKEMLSIDVVFPSSVIRDVVYVYLKVPQP